MNYDKAIELITKYEQFYPTATYTPAGVYVLGYGSTRGVRKGDTIDHDQAIERVRSTLDNLWNQLKTSIMVPITTNQANAILDLAYNFGVNAIKSSMLVYDLNHHRNKLAEREFMTWVFVDGERDQKMEMRRNDERTLFTTPE